MPTFYDAWKGPPVKCPSFAADATGGPLEQCSYWLDGLVRLGYVLHDDALVRKATNRLALVVDGVNRGGTSFIYWKKEPPEGFNSWAHSHMGRALVAWYEASGDRRILDALVAVYRRLSRAMGHLHAFGDAVQRPVQSRCHDGDLLFQRRSAAVASARERPSPQPTSRRRIGAWLARTVHRRACGLRLRADPPARTVLSGHRRAKHAACRPRTAPFAGSTRITCSPMA